MTELEEWDALLKTPAWLRLCAYVKTQWEAEIGMRLEQAVNTANDLEALKKMQALMAGRAAALQVLEVPTQRILSLKSQGVLRDDDQGRRGRL